MPIKNPDYAGRAAQQAWGYEFDGFVLDARRRGVWRRDGGQVRLTARLFNTLLLFVERPGELLGKDWLMDTLWPGMDVGENSLSQVVCGLRRALCGDGREYIQTESRHGFRFVCPVRTQPRMDDAWHLAPHLDDTAPRGPAGPTSDGIGGHAPSRTPAFPS
jgi:DNA-binding winged helix-turn-helix (wHTH) protein